MAIPNTRETFKSYILRSLGSPVIEINVADEQMEDRIDEAIQLYHLFHMDAVDRMILTHTIIQDDIDNKYIEIGEPVMSIINVIWNYGSFTGGDFASGLWQYQADMFNSLGFKSTCSNGSSLSGYAISMQHLANMESIMANKPTVQYSMHSNRLYIDDDWSKFSVGDSIAYEAYVKLDPSVYSDVWNDVWLKEYAIALAGIQWGRNLQKFQQVELPGGIVLNGDEIFNQYNDERIRLKEELELRYEYPPDMDIG